MARFRFVHAADLHLDTPFEGLGRVAPHIAEQLRDASLSAFDRLVELTLAEDAAFLLLAGDIYDGAERGIRAQIRFRQGLVRLSAAGVRVFIVHGNHDPLDGWSAIREWPEGVTVFGADRAASVPVIRDNETLAVVHGISYPTRAVTENLSRRFARTGHDALQVGLLHCLVGSSDEHEAYSPCVLDDLRAAAMDYWALGHVHTHAVLQQRGSEGGDAGRRPWVVYPGNTQARSAVERGPRGAVVGTVEDGAVVDLRFVATDLVRFDQCSVDIGRLADLPALMDALSTAAETARAGAEGRGLILRGLLTGRGPLHADLARPGALDELTAELRNAASGLDPFLWWERLADGSAGLIDRARIRERGDFSAELLLRAEFLEADPDDRRRFAAAAWSALAPLGLAAPSDDETAALLDEATMLAVEMLETAGTP